MRRLIPGAIEPSSTERRVMRTLGGKTVWADEVQILGPNVHTALPAAGAVPPGSLFSCSTHSLIYRTDGAAWTTWATLGGGGSGSLTVQDENGNVATGVTQIDFQGVGVTAAAGSGEVIVTIPGGGGGGSGALLALTNYNPGTSVVASTTSTTAADADPTNLSIAFTAPASGQVIVRLNALGTQTATSASVRWYIREGTTTVGVRYMTASKNTAWDFLGAATYVITGLTPGSSHTYKWGHSVSAGQSNISAGGTTGAAIMEVWAA